MTISEVLAALKDDLREARKIQGKPALHLETCEIELQVGIEKKAAGEISFSVLGTGGKVGADGKRTDTHKIKLVFRPQPEATIAEMLEEVKDLKKVVSESGLKQEDFALKGLLGPFPGPAFAMSPEYWKYQVRTGLFGGMLAGLPNTVASADGETSSGIHPTASP